MTEPPLTTTNPLTSCQATTTMMSGNSGHAHHSHSHHHSSGTKNEQMLSPSGGDAQTTTTTSVVTSKDDEESSDCKSPGQRYVNRFFNSNKQHKCLASHSSFNIIIHLSRCRPQRRKSFGMVQTKKEKNKTKTKLLVLFILCLSYYDNCHKLHNGNDSEVLVFQYFTLDLFYSLSNSQWPKTIAKTFNSIAIDWTFIPQI